MRKGLTTLAVDTDSRRRAVLSLQKHEPEVPFRSIRIRVLD